MPYRNPTYKMLMFVFYAGAAFWLLPIVFTGLQLQEVFNSLVFSIATVILMTWGSAAYYAFKGRMDPENQQIISTVAVWFIVWVQRLYAITFVALDRPTWLMVSALPAFLTYMFGVMGVLVIMAPAFMKDVNLRSYYAHLVVGIFIAAILFVISYAVQVQ